MNRKVTFEQACARFVYRFTFDHIPQWARKTHYHSELGQVYYAPSFASDREWYENTLFPGEPGLHGNSAHCETGKQSWPLGQGFLREPFHLNRNQRVIE